MPKQRVRAEPRSPQRCLASLVERAAGARGGGTVNGASASRRGISIGTSTGIGRGCVSNTSGKPMMPIAQQHHRADQPLARARARLLHGVGAARVVGLSGAGSRFCLNMRGADVRAEWRTRCASASDDVATGALGQSVLQHAADGVERAEDDDSISGVRGGDRRGERSGGTRVGRHRCCRTDVSAARARRARRAASALAARGVGRSVRCQCVDQRRHARQDRRDVLVAHRAEDRVACAERSPSGRGFAPARRPRAGCARRRGRSSARPGTIWKRPGSSTVASPMRMACALIGSRSRSASSAASAPDALSKLVGAAQRRIGERRSGAAATAPAPLLAVARLVEVAADEPQVGADRAAPRRRRSAAASDR